MFSLNHQKLHLHHDTINHLLICMICLHAVNPKTTERHLADNHSNTIPLDTRKAMGVYSNAMSKSCYPDLKTMMRNLNPPIHAIPHVNVILNCFACSVAGCTEAMGTKESMVNHLNTSHEFTAGNALALPYVANCTTQIIFRQPRVHTRVQVPANASLIVGEGTMSGPGQVGMEYSCRLLATQSCVVRSSN